MTVAELIAKLQQMPQDLPVYRHDASWDTVSVDEVEVRQVNEEDHDLTVPIAQRLRWELTAVVIG